MSTPIEVDQMAIFSGSNKTRVATDANAFLAQGRQGDHKEYHFEEKGVRYRYNPGMPDTWQIMDTGAVLTIMIPYQILPVDR